MTAHPTATRDIISDVVLNIGGEKILGKSTGLMHVYTGEIQITQKYTSSLSFINPIFFASIMLTGLPHPETILGDGRNPFKEAKSFSFERKIIFSDGNELEAIGKYSRPDDTTFSGTIEASGDIPATPAKTVLPTIETWNRKSTTIIDGFFEMAWETDSASIISATARTEYKLEGVDLANYPVRQFRSITIQNSYQDQVYIQDEQISVFCSVPGHSAKMRFLEPLVK